MSKIAFISDIHSNFEALREVLNVIDGLGINKIYCLGDVTGYYSQVNECCDELRKREIPVIMGNHDWYLAGGGFCPRSKSVNDCLVYQRKVITKENLSWIKKFPIQLEVKDIKMVHGGWANPIDEYLNNPTKEYFDNVEGKYFVSGHTHLARIDDFGDKVYCNPGSVGQPRDNDPRASFAIFDGEFKLFRVRYNIQKTCILMDEAGFNNYYYGCLETGEKNLCKPKRNNVNV
ncbi:MAG TPA: metallophosphoesterase family protein [Lachnospiraceae bacterium]|nr:metallophosphoesterase family protein [Lachnospiraceae bacterium]